MRHKTQPGLDTCGPPPLPTTWIPATCRSPGGTEFSSALRLCCMHAAPYAEALTVLLMCVTMCLSPPAHADDLREEQLPCLPRSCNLRARLEPLLSREHAHLPKFVVARSKVPPRTQTAAQAETAPPTAPLR